MGPDPAVAECRHAVRGALADLPPGSLVLVACSGGADSTALAAAVLFTAPRTGLRAGVVSVDHGLQPGSAARAAAVARWAEAAGADLATVRSVPVGRSGGPEAAARTARYAALAAAAEQTGAAAVLLGHTRTDQAETVLLGLARGSGARSLAGMAARTGRYRRPFLGVDRATTVRACAALGLPVWDDPHNSDPAYARARVRGTALPALEAALGPGVAAALARTGEQLRADADALDGWAARVATELRGPDGALAVGGLEVLPAAVRGRVLRGAALAAGAPAGALSATHVAAMDALVVRWHGQRAASLPGGLAALRRCGFLHVIPPPDPPAARPRSPDVPQRPGDADIESILITEKEIGARIEELAGELDRDYAGRELILVGVLKGAVMFMADLARALRTPLTMDFMAVSSYGSATSSSGVVRILKDLDRDLTGQHVLLVEDIIDSGLTLSWLLRNLRSRGPASLEVCALLRKPEALQVDIPVAYTGFDIPSEFVVGYGLDYAQHYRNLPYVGTLRPEVYRN